MSILNQKKKVFGNIAALKTLTEGFPKLRSTSSFPSINSKGDSIAFLCDLIKALIGYQELVKQTVDTLIFSIKDIEDEIKTALKNELKLLVNCGVDPNIPSFIKSTSNGITFPLNKIDYADIMRVNPNGPQGNLIYNDITPNLIDSSDFNTFLFQTVQNNGTVERWGHTTSASDIFDIEFNSIDITGTNPNNSLTVKANSAYDNKTLTELNNDYIDSISLFNTEHLVSNIVDNVFGSISSIISKPISSLNMDAKLNTVINKIVNSTTDTIEDKVFQFTNDEIQSHDEIARLRQRGISIINGSNDIISQVPVSTLSDLHAEMLTATTTDIKRTILASNLDKMATISAENSPYKVDVPAIKLNFIQEIINNLVRAVINTVISPKVILIFMINYKIVYGPSATFNDPIDFIRKNKTLFNGIMKKASQSIIKTLLAVALKEISNMVSVASAKREVEKAKSNLTQLLSLIGIPQETLRIIKGI